MTHPLVTIGITAFNAADSIERALTSALGQTWPSIEVVVVDDCSSDDTVAAVEGLARADGRIRLVRHPENQGVAAARNTIIAEARGLFIAFFDDDDESLPDRVERQVGRIVDYERDFAGGAPVICHAARVLIYPDGTEKLAPTMGQRMDGPCPAGAPVALRVLTGEYVADAFGACATCSQMARRSTYTALGGFDVRFRRSEDTDFTVRAALAGAHFAGIAEPLVRQVMARTSDKSLADEHHWMRQLLEKHKVALSTRQHAFASEWLDLKEAWLDRRPLAFLRHFSGLVVRSPVATVRRLACAFPNYSLNRAFRRFYTEPSRLQA
jgi:glycosyltransferase involved in cell wall biosynthesis